MLGFLGIGDAWRPAELDRSAVAYPRGQKVPSVILVSAGAQKFENLVTVRVVYRVKQNRQGPDGTMALKGGS